MWERTPKPALGEAGGLSGRAKIGSVATLPLGPRSLVRRQHSPRLKLRFILRNLGRGRKPRPFKTTPTLIKHASNLSFSAIP